MSVTVEQNATSSVFIEPAMTQAIILVALLNRHLEALSGKSKAEAKVLFSFDTQEIPHNEYLYILGSERADQLPSILIKSGVSVAAEQVNFTEFLANIGNLSPLPATMEQILQTRLKLVDLVSTSDLMADETSNTLSYISFCFTCVDREVSFYVHHTHLGEFLHKINSLSDISGDTQNTPISVNLNLYGPQIQEGQFPLYDGDVVFVNQLHAEQPSHSLAGYISVNSSPQDFKKYFANSASNHQHNASHKPTLMITLKHLDIPASFLSLSETELSKALTTFFAYPQRAYLYSQITEETYAGTIFMMSNSICFRIENGQQAPEAISDNTEQPQQHTTTAQCTGRKLTENGSVYERLFGTGR